MMPSQNRPQRSVYGRMLAGSLWGLAIRWGVRLLGFASIVILARLLTPADFGLVAMATICLGLTASLTDFGANMLLMRTANATREDCDTAWTVQLIQHGIVAALLLLGAPLIIGYFNEPRLYPLLAVLAVGTVVGATANIGMTLVRKELDFAKDFRYQLYSKLATLSSTIALAIALKNYWALVAGSFIGTIGKVVISYRMHPYRPRLSLVKARQYISFSASILVLSLAKFLKQKIDVLIVGGKGSTAAMGSYNVASELAAMSIQEIVVAVWRGLYPTFASITDDRERFLQAFGHFLSTMAMVCLPLGFGLAAVAGDVVLVLLGSQWVEAVGPLRWLAMTAVLLAMIDTLGHQILIVAGYERRAALVMWVQISVLAPLVIFASTQGGSETIAMATTIAAAIVLPISAALLSRTLGFTAAMMLRAVWRPVLASAVMVAVVAHMPLPDAPALARLVASVMAGALAYASSIGVCWLIAGRPEGLELLAWRAVCRYAAQRGT